MNIREKTERLSSVRFISWPVCRRVMWTANAIEFRDWVYYLGALKCGFDDAQPPKRNSPRMTRQYK